MTDPFIPSPFNQLPNSSMRHLTLERGEAVFLQNDITSGLFFVLRGQVELERHTSKGEVVVIYRAGAGDTFAEASLFSGVYHCDARAKRPSEVVRIDKGAIQTAFQNDLEFALQITKRFAMQIQAYRRRLELLAIKDATERTMVAISDDMLTGTVMDLAAEIGLTHEAVYRSLSKLTRTGRIRKVARGRYQAI